MALPTTSSQPWAEVVRGSSSRVRFWNYREFVHDLTLDRPSESQIACALAEEAGEFMVATQSGAQADLIKELGDLTFYLVYAFKVFDLMPLASWLVAREPRRFASGLDDDENRNLEPLAKCTSARDAGHRIVAETATLCGIVYKAGRDCDGIWDSSRLRRAADSMHRLLALIIDAALTCDTSFDVVMIANTEKIMSRLNRGVLAGDGDNR